jgi:hypothetical protein
MSPPQGLSSKSSSTNIYKTKVGEALVHHCAFSSTQLQNSISRDNFSCFFSSPCRSWRPFTLTSSARTACRRVGVHAAPPAAPAPPQSHCRVKCLVIMMQAHPSPARHWPVWPCISCRHSSNLDETEIASSIWFQCWPSFPKSAWLSSCS